MNYWRMKSKSHKGRVENLGVRRITEKFIYKASPFMDKKRKKSF